MELKDMSSETLAFLDAAFLVGHTGLIFFNLFGWAWKKTLRLNLLSIFLTAGSWVAFAPWYGLGYCPCTDWHWQVKWAIGKTDLPNNYLTYLFDAWTGIAVSDEFAFRLAWGALIPALFLSLYFNLKGNGNKKKK
jgi:hypothetical protein